MRPIFEIANEISRDWSKVYFGALPYLRAMQSIETIDQCYGMDSAKTIIIYFLANAGTYKGETAKRVKKELKQLIK